MKATVSEFRSPTFKYDQASESYVVHFDGIKAKTLEEKLAAHILTDRFYEELKNFCRRWTEDKGY